ncbi:hypothetical protein [Microbacterium laevaniformans]|uniref:hypothetical protein n=1 Tax=Microbacterium laevaniformans TaxID=36807 RepID=UPI003628BD38
MTKLPPTDELVAFILRHVQDVPHRAGVEIPTENVPDFRMLYGLTQRVRRLARAYMKLRKAGFGSEGQILVRSALEHAVTAQWAYLTVGGIARLSRSYVESESTLVRQMMRYSDDPAWQEWLDDTTTAASDGPALPKFSGRGGIMEQLDSSMFLQATYKVLSQVGHVTHEAAVTFFEADENKLHLRDNPRNVVDHEVLYALAGVCMLSAWVLARLERNGVEIAKLTELGLKLHLPWRLDDELPAANRRFDPTD